MATADNKVVTFKDLYGNNGNAVLSSTNSEHLVYPYYKGAVVPDTTYGNSYSAFSNSLYSKRLKYVYYGYAFVGGNPNVLSQLQTSGGVTAYWNTGSWEKAKFMLPLAHVNNVTSYKTDTLDMVISNGAQYILDEIAQGLQTYGNVINYSSIASLADEDMVNDIWTEYKPIPKIDPSTGDQMKDENGKLLYETDDEGNVLYEEGDYYTETRRADEDVLPI